MDGAETAKPPPGPFAGIRVLDLGTGIAAPYAAMFFGDQGADVVKVEDRAGDPYRHDPGFQTINRNKRSVVVDTIELDRGRRSTSSEVLGQLVAAADVIFTDRPRDDQLVRGHAPSAVIVAMPPWGRRGPKVDDPASRTLLHAATGIAWNQQSYAEVPVDVVVPIAAYGAGVLGALAGAAGLLARVNRGVGPTYEVSQVAGAAAVQLGEFRLADDELPRTGTSALGSKGRVACYRLVEAGDGRWLFVACGSELFYRRLLDVIGRPELIDDPELANPPWGLMSDEAIAHLTPILDEAFAAKPRNEWLELLSEADVPAQPVLTRQQFLASSMVTANEMDLTVEHPDLGPVSMMGLPVVVESAPGGVTRPAPSLGQHTDEVLADWGERSVAPSSGPAGPDRKASAGDGERPLQGLRVIDLASYIAGPVVSRHLAMLGADVIKVEPRAGDPFRAIGPMFLSWNQGKRSIALDLKDPEDRAVFHRLVASADAVVENFRPGVSARLGCDEATLRACNPDLIYLSSPGYGLDDSMAARAAFDPLVQAVGGLMASQGGCSETEGEPVFLSSPIHDLITPLVGAFGVVAGWWQRRRPAEEGGGGQRVRTSLVQSTMVTQAAEFTRYAGRPAPAAGGFDYPGNPDDTWIEGADGVPRWVCQLGEVPVETFGLTASTLATENGLVVGQNSAFGEVTVFGQLVGGAGPPPTPCPELDQHGVDILGEIGDAPPSGPPPQD